MIKEDCYEKVRQKLTLGPLITPKHEKINELMKIFWNEETIRILEHFPKSGKLISLNELVKITGLQREEIKSILKKAVKKHTIAKIGAKFGLVPLLPGVFEGYFIGKADDEQNIQKVAELYRYIIKNLPSLTSQSKDFREALGKYSISTPMLPYDAQERLINIDESINVESKAISMDLIKNLIDNNELFGAVTCPCRLVGKMSGEPCNVAPADVGCLAFGMVAKIAVQLGLARSITREEAIEYIRKAEEAGLVHNVMGITDDQIDSICNCCSCHCGALSPSSRTKLELKLIGQNNYEPQRNSQLCSLCEKCVDICPMEAIEHPAGENYLIFNHAICIGCGVCAANCPENAILMIKVRDLPRPTFENLPHEEGEISLQDLIEALLLEQ